ncbi:MAG: hypothetical protein DHS20C21_01910 [Gemmatimonadota bacterium]|nr:MAG: hypothetical protein DHS20C21_01910 [Gemmatimonadota bacterium]
MTTKTRAQRRPKKLLQAQLSRALGVSGDSITKRFGSEAASRSYREESVSIVAALEEYVANKGKDVSNPTEAIQAAGGYSTVSDAFLEAADLLVREAYGRVSQVVRTIAAPVGLQNFREYVSHYLEQEGTFARVGPTGELSSSSMSGTGGMTNQIDTRGQALRVPRQTVINDDVGVIAKILTDLAKRGAFAVEQALIEAIVDPDGTFFTSDRGNLLTGKSLQASNLALAQAALWAQSDANGLPIYARPAILLVPPSLYWTAVELFRGMPPEDRLKVVTSPYLESAKVEGSSSTTWYVIADPSVLPALQVAYLGTKRRPTVETAMLGIDGLRMRGYFDFGVRAIEYRAGVKVTA